MTAINEIQVGIYRRRAAEAPTPEQLLLAWDRTRARSQQQQIGMSAIGGCRKYAGFRMKGHTPTDDGSSIQAVLGTLVHIGLGEAAKLHANPGDRIEFEVEFDGILGHLDWLFVVDPDTNLVDVIDWKSVSFHRYESAEEDGPDLNQLYQTVLYAAAVTLLGYRVRDIVLDYIGRDSGKLLRHRRPFTIEELRAALAWIARIRETDIEDLPRDYRPGSPYCDSCEFRTACWGAYARPERSPLSALFVDHPNAAAWLDMLLEGRAMEKAGKQMAEDAKGALDAIRPNTRGKSDPCVLDGPDGDRKAVRWTVYDDERLDLDQVRADYAAAGLSPPVKRNEIVKVTTLARPKNARSKGGGRSDGRGTETPDTR